MKTKTPLSALNRFIIAIAALLAANMPALAVDLYWDANGNTAGTGGSQLWSTTGSFWRTNSSTGTLGTWLPTGSNNAYFEGTAGFVTNGSTSIELGGGTAFFNTTGYTLRTDGNIARVLNGNISIGNGLILNFDNDSANTGSRILNVGGNISGGTFVIRGA